MYDKILVAVDHSEISDRALLAARDLALLSQGEVWVLHLREREIAVKTSVVMSDETAEEANAKVSAAVDTLTQAYGASSKTPIGPFQKTVPAARRLSAWPRPAPANTWGQAGLRDGPDERRRSPWRRGPSAPSGRAG
jgi:nucleotide-binding universal stress UspA family protein